MTADVPVAASMLTKALPLVRVTGSGRNIGKTWLAEQLVAWFRSRGYLVAAIKDSHHRMTDDKPGSDTERLAFAGASPVIFRAGDGVLTRATGSPDALRALAHDLVAHVDLVVAEGFRKEDAWARLQIGEARPRRVTLCDPDGYELGTWAIDEIDRIAGALEAACGLSAAGDEAFRAAVRRAVATYEHRCPDVTLGVRMVQVASDALGVPFPPARGAVQVVAEMARCATDALATAAACSAGQGTLRVRDRGISAATFISRADGRGVRVSLRPDVAIEMPCERPSHGVSIASEHALRARPVDGLFRIECLQPPPGAGRRHSAQGR